MNTLLEQMKKTRAREFAQDEKVALRGVFQEIVLCGLARSGFFEKAALCGSTALRLCYGLDRFSDSLEFVTKKEGEMLSFDKYYPSVLKEAASFGVAVKRVDTGPAGFMNLQFNENGEDEKIQVLCRLIYQEKGKDGCEHRYRLLPVPYELCLLDAPTLLAETISSLLHQNSRRLKGTDLYDYIFQISRGSEVNLSGLQGMLEKDGRLSPQPCTIESVRDMLCGQFQTLDFKKLAAEVDPYIRDHAALQLWNADFFCKVTEKLQAVS